jgi:formylglycine-generating enzyme required for sulfatase activity
MSGNLWEWCWDWHGSYGLGLQLDPLGASSGAIRVLRGGGWGNDAENCRSAYRNDVEPAGRSGGIGFRVLRRP